MANTTFNGPVRSENGFIGITKAAVTGAVTDNITISSTGALSSTTTIATSSTLTARRPIDTTWEASGAIDSSLTIAQSGTIVPIHGTLDNVINLPASSEANTGAYFDFVVTTAVASGKTTTVVIPTATGSTFLGQTQLAAGSAANPVITNSGDTFTFVATTGIGGRCRIECITDDGTKQIWMATSVSTPIATIG
jgi:hypothetical protein|tara:strand:+ start:31 stop:612 length:582 start_codon:yes stop_codon:yes gene_type:complete